MSLVRIGALRNICDNLAYGGRGRRMDGIVHVKTAAMRGSAELRLVRPAMA